MKTQDSPSSGGLPKWVWAVMGSLGLLFLIWLVTPNSAPQNNNPKNNTGASPSEAAESEKNLRDVLDGLRPDRLEISSDFRTVADWLEQWRIDYGTLKGHKPLTDDAELRKKLLGPEKFAESERETFGDRDASLVRQAQLCRGIIQRLITVNPEADSVEKLVSLFDFITRQVALATEKEVQDLAMTPAEVLLLGRGTAAHRTWLFAELARQSSVDVVIVASHEKPESWLVGALVPDQGLLLFDPFLGTAVPAADDDPQTPLVRKPATLAQIQADPTRLQALQVEGGRELKAEDFQKVDVKLIGNDSTWTPRMALLQLKIPTEFEFHVYEGLGKNEFREPALVERVTKLGGSPEETISIWDFPAKEELRYRSLLTQANSELRYLLDAFEGPRFYKTNQYTDKGQEKVETIEVKEKKSLRALRMKQLLRTELGETLKDFVLVRSCHRTVGNKIPPPLNRETATYGTYWIAVEQYEAGNLDAALDTLKAYLREFTGSPLRLAALRLQALIKAEQGAFPEAMKLLKDGPRNQKAAGGSFLLHRWEARRKG